MIGLRSNAQDEDVETTAGTRSRSCGGFASHGHSSISVVTMSVLSSNANGLHAPFQETVR
jgi:hypothetical protein